MSSQEPSPVDGSPVARTEPEPEELFLSPIAIPRRKNQMMAAGLAVVALLVLAIMTTLVLLIHYDNLPSLFSYFS